MSPLRQQLDAARAGYRAMHYPGDLSRDVMQRRQRSLRRRVLRLSSVALAASLLLVLWLHRPAVQVAPAPAPEQAALPVQVATSDEQIPSMAHLAESVSFTPSIPVLTIPEMPSFPAQPSLQETASTTKEAV